MSIPNNIQCLFNKSHRLRSSRSQCQYVRNCIQTNTKAHCLSTYGVKCWNSLPVNIVKIFMDSQGSELKDLETLAVNRTAWQHKLAARVFYRSLALIIHFRISRSTSVRGDWREHIFFHEHL